MEEAGFKGLRFGFIEWAWFGQGAWPSEKAWAMRYGFERGVAY